MSTAIEQCEAGFTALAQYFTNVSQYVSSGSSIPDPYSLYGAMNFEEILTYVKASANGSADFSIGAGIETLNHFVAVERELAMTEVGKTEIYISSISEANREATFLSQNASFMPAVIGGATTNGSQC